MTVQMQVTGDGFRVSGELDMDGADDFRVFAASQVDRTRELVLDIADLTFLDSSGVRAIARLAEFYCPKGLVLRWPRDNVQRILDILSIEDVPGVRVERGGPTRPD